MWRVIIDCVKQLDTFLPFWIVVICSLVSCGVSGECPQDVQVQADTCFTDYSAQFQNMRNSQYKMCCGVDVETLRAFCSAYLAGMRCYKHLKSVCTPEQFHLSDHTLMNIRRAEEGLNDLCSDDHIYEKYARHQNCFNSQGYDSERCLSTHMNSTNLRLMSTVPRKSTDELCRDMKNTLNCIKPNIQRQCGPEAAKLVELLIKPMIRGIGQCDYNVIHIESTEKPQHHQPSRTHSSMDDSNKYITDNGSGATSLFVTSHSNMAALVVLLCVILMH